MRNSSIILILAVATSVVLTSCGSNTKEAATSSEEQPSIIKLTSTQASHINVKLYKLEKRTLSDHVQANGKLDVPPQNMAIVAAPIAGFVRWTPLLEGMKVKKGSTIARLENLEYVELQQSYLDAVSKLTLYESEYNRQVILSKENVNAEKTLQQAKAQFDSQTAIVNGLEAKLKLINLVPSEVRSGNIKSTINIYAPISGYITEVNVKQGQYAQTADVMFKIVNLEHVHAELYVYEKDITRLAMEQRVMFHLPNDTTVRTATVFLIGREISNDRTVRVHCHLDKEDESLLPGMFVTAEIEVGAIDANVVPDQALVTHNGDTYLFTEIAPGQYKPNVVQTGKSSGGFTQLFLPEGFDASSPVVIEGAFELLGLLANNEEED